MNCGGMGMRGEPDSVLLNIAYVERRFRELDLKQWWVAEQIGVNRQTVMRWFTGQVKRARTENVQRLAECLACPVDVLIAAKETDVFATSRDQKDAAELIIDEDLYNLCRKERKLALLESIARSVLAPNLPLGRLAELYLLLSYTRISLHEFQDGLDFAERALSTARKIGDESMAARAQSRKASALFNMGRLEEARHLHSACYDQMGEVDLAAKKVILVNVGIYLMSCDVPDFTLDTLKNAEGLDPEDSLFVLNIHRLRGRALLQKGDWEKAQEELDEALAMALSDGDRNEEFHTRTRLHDCLLRSGRYAEGAEELARLEKLAIRLKGYETQVLFRQMKQFNAEGRHQEAVGLVARLLRATERSPLVRRNHLKEIARTYGFLGRSADVERTLGILLGTFPVSERASVKEQLSREFPVVRKMGKD